ncbi:MAG: hypothetical protein AAF708_17605 [Deinococcota bacterium]
MTLYDKILEVILVGLFLAACMIAAPALSIHNGILGETLPPSFDRLTNYLDSQFTIFFLISLAFNCTFLKLKKGFLFLNGFLGIVLTSFFDLFLYIFYILSSLIWSAFVFSYGVFTLLISCFIFGTVRVAFTTFLPLKRSENFIGLYPISLVILLLLFLV